MEKNLRAYLNYLQDKQPDWLTMAKFVDNNNKSEATKLTPFLFNKRFYSCTGFQPIEPINVTSNELNTNSFINLIKKFKKVLQGHMLLAQVDHGKYADGH